jgi:hypothetical protein
MAASDDNTPSDPSAIAAAASCFDDCIPDGAKLGCIIYLLNQLLGANFTPQQLVTNSACYDTCIPDGMKQAVMIYLLWALANDFD